MLLGYNTNGLAHHALLDAVELLAGIGYRSVAVTIDHGASRRASRPGRSSLPPCDAACASWGCAP